MRHFLNKYLYIYIKLINQIMFQKLACNISTPMALYIFCFGQGEGLFLDPFGVRRMSSLVPSFSSNFFVFIFIFSIYYYACVSYILASYLLLLLIFKDLMIAPPPLPPQPTRNSLLFSWVYDDISATQS